jgi:hypothetical protein
MSSSEIPEKTKDPQLEESKDVEMKEIIKEKAETPKVIDTSAPPKRTEKGVKIKI